MSLLGQTFMNALSKVLSRYYQDSIKTLFSLHENIEYMFGGGGDGGGRERENTCVNGPER
jgi:hypothetical protein